MRARFACIAIALSLLSCGCETRREPPTADSRGDASGNAPRLPRFQSQLPWVDEGIWLRCDTHLHTKFSDGSMTVAEVVERAAGHGCDVVAITDHADQNLMAATPEYREAIRAARGSHPELVILAGLEWNVPPYGGDEHATVLAPISPNEWDVLTGFKARFDDYKRGEQPAALADEALRWLSSQYAEDVVQPVVILNHPSRKRDSSASVLADMQRWSELNQIVIGMSGAPGHQRGEPNGAYKQQLQTVNRWDPVVEIGAEWDQLLGAGIDVWAARAPSDLHRAEGKSALDYWPGQFSETWVYAAEKSADAVLRAIRAGSFFGGHGHAAREVRLTVQVEGLRRPAQPGETIEVAEGTALEIGVTCRVPDKDWQGAPNRLDSMELIGVFQDAARSLVVLPTDTSAKPELMLTHEMKAPTGGVVVRARGRRKMESGGDYQFYTNSIRVISRADAANR